MPPRKKNKKQDQIDEELDRKEKNSKWAQLLDENDDVEEELLIKKKQVFTYDFSQEHLLLKQKDIPPPEKPKIILTPQEEAQLKRRLEKEAKEKEQKAKRKAEKKKIRDMQIEKDRELKQQEEQEEKKMNQELQKKMSKSQGNSDTRKIMCCLFALLILLSVMQYHGVIYAKLSKFKLEADVNYYEILQTDSSATESQLKAQYKMLVLKYHPDKNPSCQTCKEKFQSVMNAWEILGDSEKRKSYDQNSGFIAQIPTKSIILTSQNYNYLLDDSDQIWVIEVIDSTSEHCHYFASFWEEAVSNFHQLASFGRVDLWQDSNMKSYLPYSFQIFPGLYSVHRGVVELCQIDYQRPLKNIEICLQKRVQDNLVIKVNSISEIKDEANKKSLIIGSGVGQSFRFKLILNKYSRYLNYYQIPVNSNKVNLKDSAYQFDFSKQKGKQGLKKYQKFIQGIVVQTKSLCQIHYECKESPCIILLNHEIPITSFSKYPIYKVLEEKELMSKIQVIKRLLEMNELFDLALYEDGKIELGYFGEDLSPDNGEVIDFSCHEQTILRSLVSTTKKLLKMINGSSL